MWGRKIVYIRNILNHVDFTILIHEINLKYAKFIVPNRFYRIVNRFGDKPLNENVAENVYKYLRI